MLKKIFLILIFIIAMLLIVETFLYYKIINLNRHRTVIQKNVSLNGKSNSAGDVVAPKKETGKTKEITVPDRISIKVPFITQAPFGKWDVYHEEACEEASLVMLKYYLENKKLNPETAEKEIQKMIAYEIKNYGDYKDSSAEQVVRLARDFYGINNLKVVYDFQAADLKKYLALNKPIIVPAAGRLLNNPNFTPPGPLYHNLVLVGYDGSTIITNDPGTRKGEGYKYDINVLYNAIHDFSGDLNNIEKGRKAMIILE